MAEPGVVQLAHENRSSIELTRNYKGEQAFVIKVYGDQDAPGGRDQMLDHVNYLYGEMLRRYGS